MSPDEAPAAPAPAQRSASTARRERRDRCSYLAGERAGMLAGLKEAAGLAEERSQEAFRQRDFCQANDMAAAGLVHGAVAGGMALLLAAIRARIAEIEGEAVRK